MLDGILWAAALFAAVGDDDPQTGDLSRVPRILSKEPAYNSRQPRYCLLVFGPKAATRIWLVVDGLFLYVDRNGNNDVTESGEQIEGSPVRNDDGTLGVQFQVDNVRVNDGKVIALQVSIDPRSIMYDSVTTFGIDNTPLQWAGGDAESVLKFGNRPQEAPVLHFDGPLSMYLSDERTLRRGTNSTTLVTRVGTLGIGRGSFVAVFEERVPKECCPMAEITWQDESTPKSSRFKLLSRC